jgi:MoaA/NifB/PqqE/SkfB family radical SAM enzyme
MKCYAPWHALSIRFNGDVVPDCVYTGRHGNLLKEDLPTILRNPGLIHTQRTIASGQFPSNCLQCTAKESANGHSRRKFFEQVLNPMLKPESNLRNDIYFLEFNMSNLCNLKCRMCSGVNSTAWIKEDLKLDKMGVQRPIHEPDFGYRNLSPDIVDRLFEYPEYFKNLQYVNIKGGEPYMEPANKQIMQKLIELNLAKNITLDISTNGTVVDLEFDELAHQFKETKWHISIEGTGKLYEYIRGGDNFPFEQLVDNLQQLDKMDRLIFAGTIMTYNVCHVKDIVDWFYNIKKPHYELYVNNVVTTPAYLNPQILPERILDGTGYRHKDSPIQLEQFVDFTRKVDELRGTDILDVCPELSSLFS